MKNILIYITSAILGFIYAVLAFGKHTGEEGIIPNIRIHFYRYEFLAHHWLMFPIYAFLIYLLFSKNKKYKLVINFVIAFLLGAAIQGFTYSDWYILFK